MNLKRNFIRSSKDFRRIRDSYSRKPVSRRSRRLYDAALKEEVLYAVEEATSPDNVVMLSERLFTDSEGNEFVVKAEQNADDDVAHLVITPEDCQVFKADMRFNT